MRVRRLSLLVIALFFVAVSVVAVAPASPARAQEGQDATQSNEQNSEVSSDPQEPSYRYRAQAGDSYSKMARKAVQTYGLTNSINLSGAKILYAETHLTLEAGSPQLNLDQDVFLTEASVKAWVEKAMAITAEEETAWDYYVQFVNFNTDNVGEARS